MARLTVRYVDIILASCIVVVAISIVVMVGWINHIDILTTVRSNYAAMKFNTALSFLMMCFSLSFLAVPVKTSPKILLMISKVMAASVFLLGLLSIIQLFTDNTFTIDRLFFGHNEDHLHNYIISPQTCVCICLMGLSLYYIRAKRLLHRKICQYILHLVSLVAFVVLIGYMYDVDEFHNFSMVSSMAVHTALSFFILSIASSFLNPALGITGIFTGNMLGNLMARRLFFSLLTCILLAGYIRILSHKYGIVSVEFGIALLTIVFCIITLIFIWIVSSILTKAHRRLQAAKENLKVIVEAAPYALVMSDKKGNIIDVNNKTKQIFGYNASELINKNVAMLVPETFRDDWMGKRTAFFNSPSVKHYGFDDEIPAIRKDGTVFPIEIVLTPIKTDNGVTILSFVNDITARKNNEAIITKQLIELQSKNQELEQFNYISSHDLQEPLRTLLNYIQLLEEDYPDLHPEVLEHLKVMEASVKRMSNVVRSLLDFGRLGRNKKLVLTDCRKIINDVLADLNTIVKQNNATIVIKDEDQHPKIYAYETELRQLFQNLINNAIKFRKSNVDPYIELSCKRISGYYEFAVSDNGIGIERKHFEKVFDIFQRLNKESEFEGHGIGLANCKKIAEMHGGKIWVESTPGEGSTFKFTILNFKP